MKRKTDLVLDVHEKPKNIFQWLGLSFQHVFAMFGATVLVPILTGLPISVALVASGAGTLIYILCTKGKVPVYLGSSFAYIAAIIAASGFGTEKEVLYNSAFTGLIVVGLIYIIVSLIIRFVGTDWLKKLLPPVVIGPMIAIIGLGLASVAIGQIGLGNDTFINKDNNWIQPLTAVITFTTAVVIGLKAKGFFKIIPFLFAIIVGYFSAVILYAIFDPNQLDLMFQPFKDASFFVWKEFTIVGTYKPDFSALAIFIPLAFVTIAEHIGDHTVLGEVTEKDFLQDPGLDKTLLGDGVATLFSASIGGPANTTYGENTGVVAMTKVASVWVIGGAAVIAIILGFMGYIQAAISTIPLGVIGGISVLLFGLIAANGLKVLVKGNVNMQSMRNIIIIATMLIVGLGGAKIKLDLMIGGVDLGKPEITGMALAAVIGVILNLSLPKDTSLESEVDTTN